MTAPAEELPTVERPPDFYWHARPVYRCSVCGPRYERVNGLADVLEHEASKHPPAEPVVRESPILGPSGESLFVVETGGKEHV